MSPGSPRPVSFLEGVGTLSALHGHLHVGHTRRSSCKRNKVDNKPFLNMSKERSENWGLLTEGQKALGKS